MSRVDSRDVSALREIRAELETIRIGGHSVFPTVLARIRELLELESMLLYCPVEEGAGWGFERFEHVALPKSAAFIRRATHYLAHAPHRYSFFDPIRPEPDQRNRVIEGVTWLERLRPGSFAGSPL